MGQARLPFVLFLLSLAALLVYSNTFSVPFHFDDEYNISNNPLVHNLANFLDFSGARYVGFLSFALNYHFGGVNVFGYHLVNLLIHIINGFLVYSLVLLLFRASAFGQTSSSVRLWRTTADRHGSAPTRFPITPSTSLRAGDPRVTGHWSLVTGHAPPWIALLTALLFIVHPIQTQAVTYVVQRFASLVALFYLLAVVCYLKWRIGETRGWKLEAGSQKLEAGKSSLQPPASSFCGIWGSWIWYIASLASTLLAMKTKENSFTLPFMILLMEWVFFRPVSKRQWKTLIPFLLTLLIVPFSMGAAPGEEQFAQQSMSLGRLDYLFTQFRVIVTYLRLLILPINQNVDYDYPAYHSLFDPAVLASFLFLIFVLGVGIYFLRNSPQPPLKLRGGEGELCRSVYFKLIAFGILWFFLTLAVESSVFPIQDVMFEHRVYLPCVGFLMAVGVGLFGKNRLKTKARPAWAVAVMVLVILSLGGAAYRRNFVWASAVTLWQDVITKAPHNAKGHHNLGSEFGTQGRLAEAVREYEIALKLKPNYPEARKNLGNAYALEGRIEEAIAEYREALRLKPDYEEARKNLEYVVENREKLMNP